MSLLLLLRPSSTSAVDGDGLPTTPLPSVRVLWRPEQFTRVANGTFETNTTGWATTAGINAAATSITRITTDSHSGSACASVVCTSTDTSGVNFDLGSDRYYSEASYGTIYVATGWVKRVSGSKRLRVTLGSLSASSERATLTITDLLDAWQPFTVRWLSQSNRTDVELAVTNGSAEALTFRLDDVAVYAVDAFSQVENGFFPVNTTGWNIAGGSIAGAATSLTWTAAGGFATQSPTCAELLTTTTSGSGAEYALGNRRFTSGRTYRFRVALRRKASGLSGTAKLHFGSMGTAGDRATATVTLNTNGNVWAWHTVDWTPSADRTDAAIAITNSAANSTNPYIDHVEVYEASDDIGQDVDLLRWDRKLDTIGSIVARVRDHDGEYHPRNTAAALYGSLAPGRRIWGRATYSDALYPLFFGTVTTIEPPALGGMHTDILAEDVMGDLSRAQHASSYLAPEDGWTFATVRERVIDAMMTQEPRRFMGSSTATVVGSSRTALPTTGIEAGPLYYGTDDIVTAAEALDDLNEATQTVHYAAPHVSANIGWRYTTVLRTALTDTDADFTVDETTAPTDFTGIRTSKEGMETRQIVPWQAYEKLPEPPGIYVVQALDRSEMAGSADLTEDDPYLHFRDDQYGDSLGVPEPSYRAVRRWRRRKKGRRVVTFQRRIYPDAFVPFTMAAGETKRIDVEFAVAVDGMDWGYTVLSGAGPNITIVEETPTRSVIDLTAQAAVTVTSVYMSGLPYTVLDEQQAEINLGTEAYPGPSFSTPYVPSAGMAEGIAAYRNWRFGTAPMRPTLYDHNIFPRTLTAGVTDHFDVTLDRWYISALPFVSLGCLWEVSSGGLDWQSWHELEELPTHTDWFVLDSSSIGGADILAY